MFLTISFITALAAAASATRLFVSSYAGNVTTLKFSRKDAKLNQLASTDACKPNPSWLSYDSKNSNLYCLDENVPGDLGNLHAFKVHQDVGVLVHVNNVTVPQAPVNSLIYTSPNGTQVLFAAHYTTALTSWLIDFKTGGFVSEHQYLNFTLFQTGPKEQQMK